MTGQSGGDSFHDFVHISQVLRAFLEEDLDMDEVERQRPYAIQSGFSDLDALLGGIKRSDLVIVGARPSVGKSSFALGIARNAAIAQNANVAFFSLEMSAEQLATRLLAAEAEVDCTRLRVGQHTEPEERRIIRATGELAEANIWFDDSPVLTAAELCARSRCLAGSHGLDLIVIDYLQLMRSEASSGARDSLVPDISFISRTLKGLARELEVSVVALVQLSEVIETDRSRTPLLSDFDSDSIEQHADVVMLLSREEMYVTQEQWSEQHPELPESAYPRGVAHVIVAKHRNGPTGMAELRFRQKLAKFTDWVFGTDGDPYGDQP